jgi:hypothetical protein
MRHKIRAGPGTNKINKRNSIRTATHKPEVVIRRNAGNIPMLLIVTNLRYS